MIARRTLLIGLSVFALPAQASTQRIATHLLDHTNVARTRQRHPRLTPNRRLVAASQAHARRMLNLDEFSHTAGGTTMTGRVRATGYRFRRITENIAWLSRRNATDAQIAAAIHALWMTSPGHTANILDTAVTEIGIGVARRKNKIFAVQVFGRPA